MGAGETDRQQRASPRSLAGLFLLSLATLLLELALTRVLSVSLWYHFGFLVISTALLGFGAAGVTVALSSRLRDAVPAERPAAWASLGFALAALGGFWLLQRIPFDPFGLLADRRQLLLTPLAYLCLAAPFYAAGVGIAALLARGGRDVPRLYAADLCGAAAGCMALAWVMPQVGGSGSVVVAVALACAAAAVFAAGLQARLAAVSSVLAIVFALLAPSADQLLPITITPNKRAPASAPLYSAWNTFSRIDVLETPARTGNPASRTIIIDKGTAATGIMDLRPGVEAILSKPEPSGTLNTSAVYVGKERPSVLVIASGAGREVLEALRVGARNVVAVEMNPIITDIVSRRMADFWGGLFSRPEVRLVTEEGRSFVRRSTERYDVIVSTHAISNAAVAAGALSLAENYLLTREAFEDYLDHLAPDGAMFMTRPEAQLPRLVATAREAFEARGLGGLRERLVVFRMQPAEGTMRRIPGLERRKTFVAGLVLRTRPFSGQDVLEVERRLGVGLPPEAGESYRRPEILYAPGRPSTDPVYEQLVGSDLRALYASSTALLEPATDDRPFFNQHSRFSSLSLATLRQIFSEQKLGRYALEDQPVAEVTLLVVLVQSALVAGVLILLPLWRFARAGLSPPGVWRMLGYFAGLGLGFILIEMALLQRFTLFLGQPVYTLAVVLSGLLLFTGLGSALSSRWAVDPDRAVIWMPMAVPLVLALTVALMALAFRVGLGWPLSARVAVTVALLVPLGITLGLPFPTGLRMAASRSAVLVPWAWGVNAFFTVIGSVAGTMLGMAVGFRVVLVLASVCYVAVGLLVAPLRRSPSR